jgi:hypothetical protein
MATTGAEVKVGYAFATTWGTAASVTKQLLMSANDGMEDGVPQLVVDEGINQDFRMEDEAGDRKAASFDLTTRARYEATDALFAAACGSAATPAVVSSAGASSLVAYRHVVTLAKALTHMITFAVDMKNYVVEVPTARVKGFTLKVGDNGVMDVTFPMVGAYTNYTSSININSTIGGAAAPQAGTRLFRKNGTLRMNAQSAGSLVAGDAFSAILREMTFTYTRSLVDDDTVFSQDYIISPDDNDFPDLTLDLKFARMSSACANSLAIGLQAVTAFKADLDFLGTYINSTTRREWKMEMPCLQLVSYKAPFSGHQQVRPEASLALRQASAAPTGMAGITNPFQLTIVNANSAQLAP